MKVCLLAVLMRQCVVQIMSLLGHVGVTTHHHRVVLKHIQLITDQLLKKLYLSDFFVGTDSFCLLVLLGKRTILKWRMPGLEQRVLPVPSDRLGPSS